MATSTVGFGVRLADRYSIVRAYQSNPLYKPIIAPMIATFNQLYSGALYGVLGYSYLTPEEETTFETQLRNDANSVLQYIMLKRLDAPVKVSVESVDITSTAATVGVAVKSAADTVIASRTFSAAPLTPGEVPADFGTIWNQRLKAAKDRVVHGIQNTDYEIVKQLAIEGWRYRFGRHLPAIYQIKHKLNLGAVPGDTIKERAVDGITAKFESAVDAAQAKWLDKARIILAAVNSSASTVAWVISETLAVTS